VVSGDVVAGDVVVSWIDEGGQRGTGPLGMAAGTAFEDALPAREFLSYRGQRYFTGMWWLATSGRHVGYESWLERDHVMALDFDREVTGVSSQPFTLSWNADGRTVSHTPDYFARLADGSALVVDVRPADRVGPKDRLKFEVTEAACAVAGNWSFRLVHELPAVLATNVRWLSGYRHPRHADPDLGPALRQVFAGGAPLLAGVSQVADPIRGLPVLFHLLWRGDLVADLAVPLGDGTRVSGREAA
jgi:hypothetical protein